MDKSNIINAYNNLVIQGKIIQDEEQLQIISQIQKILNLISKKNIWHKLKRYNNNIYLWGSVGVGKTLLLDLFFNNFPSKHKHRWHILSLMQIIDHKLRTYQGHKNPLKKIFNELFSNTQLICLDEFYVTDILQAELLNNCFNYWKKHKISFFITSNTQPEHLFANGQLQEKFLPTINLIKTHAKIIKFGKNHDYRITKNVNNKNYINPIPKNFLSLRHQYLWLQPHWNKNGFIEILGRNIPYIRQGKQIIWFEFNQICAIPRSQLDYLELCNKYEVFILSNIPKLKPDNLSQVILLINFIDVIYDKHKNLICISNFAIEQIYAEGPMIKAFMRTKSRINELSSKDLPINALN